MGASNPFEITNSNTGWSIFDGRVLADLPPEALDRIDKRYPTLQKRVAATVAVALRASGVLNDHREVYDELRELERRGRYAHNPGGSTDELIHQRLDAIETIVNSEQFLTDMILAEGIKSQVRLAASGIFAQDREDQTSYSLEEGLRQLRVALPSIPVSTVLDTAYKRKSISQMRLRHCQSVVSILALSEIAQAQPEILIHDEDEEEK